MTTNTNNNIKAKVRTDKPDEKWTKAKDDSSPKQTYYYMFTGGYLYENNTIGKHTQNEDDGPAGEVEILTGLALASSWPRLGREAKTPLP